MEKKSKNSNLVKKDFFGNRLYIDDIIYHLSKSGPYISSPKRIYRGEIVKFTDCYVYYRDLDYKDVVNKASIKCVYKAYQNQMKKEV